jgi:hypothetical protein
MAWEKLSPHAGKVHRGCLLCPETEHQASMGTLVAVGFGSCSVTRDSEVVWEEMPDTEEFHSVEHFELIAAADPDHDWRIDMQGPLRGRTYQRHGPGQWVLIDANKGFA